MQIGIKRIGTRTNADRSIDPEFAAKHHRAGLHTRQRFSAQADRGGWQVAQTVFNHFLQVSVKWVASSHFTLSTGQDTNTATEPLTGACTKKFHTIKPGFDIRTAVHHELIVALHQATVLWFNSSGK